jgi:hypothetical protein
VPQLGTSVARRADEADQLPVLKRAPEYEAGIGKKAPGDVFRRELFELLVRHAEGFRMLQQAGQPVFFERACVFSRQDSYLVHKRASHV